MKLTQLTLTFPQDVTIDIQKLHDGIFIIAPDEDLSEADKELVEDFCRKLFEYDFDFD